MARETKIEWCDHTFNPWEGCTKVSPGCFHCYAAARNQRFAGGENWGKGAPRRRTSASNWKEPLKWNRTAAEVFNDYEAHKGLHGGFAHYDEPRNPRVFCASLADWLDEEVPLEWLADLLDLISRTPFLDWLLLTKRPENWEKRVWKVGDMAYHPGGVFARQWYDARQPPANIWIGTSVEDQPRADKRIPLLLKIPARVRFLSCEPLLRDVCIERIPQRKHYYEGTQPLYYHPLREGIHWVICGGESGHGARPMHPDWARSLRDQCNETSVPFFFKQWGEWGPTIDSPIVKLGKLAAGRLLDGKEHSEFPKTTQ